MSNKIATLLRRGSISVGKRQENGGTEKGKNEISILLPENTDPENKTPLRRRERNNHNNGRCGD